MNAPQKIINLLLKRIYPFTELNNSFNAKEIILPNSGRVILIMTNNTTKTNNKLPTPK